MESVRSQRYRFTPELPLLPTEPCIPLDSLPPELLQIIIAEHLKDRTDILALSRTCHALHCLTSSPALEAAWLWRWHGDQALFHRRSYLSMPVLRQLVEVHHADINALEAGEGGLSFSLLHLACDLDRTELVEFLISAPIININLACGGDQGMKAMPLHTACIAGSVRAVQQLLALPQIQVNAATLEGASCLHLACIERNSEVVEELLKHPDVDVNLMTVLHAHPALSLAAVMGSSAIVALLLQHPAIDVNVGGGRSPLSLASHKGHARVVRQLLRHPDIRVDGVTGYTSLGIACFMEHLSVIRELLLHPGLETDNIRAALATSEERGQTAVVALLKGSRAVRRALRRWGGA